MENLIAVVVEDVAGTAVVAAADEAAGADIVAEGIEVDEIRPRWGSRRAVMIPKSWAGRLACHLEIVDHFSWAALVGLNGLRNFW